MFDCIFLNFFFCIKKKIKKNKSMRGKNPVQTIESLPTPRFGCTGSNPPPKYSLDDKN